MWHVLHELEFQSLIGRLQTLGVEMDEIGFDPFQSLIGRLQTCHIIPRRDAPPRVSIPHR